MLNSLSNARGVHPVMLPQGRERAGHKSPAIESMVVPHFSGATKLLSEDKAKLDIYESEQAEAQKELESAEEFCDTVGKVGQHTGAVVGTIAGGATGLAAGGMGTLTVVGTDMGAMTVAGTVSGGVAGNATGKGLGKLVGRDVLGAGLNKLMGGTTRTTIQNNILNYGNEIAILKPLITEGDRLIGYLVQLLPKVKNAPQAKGFIIPPDYLALRDGLANEYKEVEASALEVKAEGLKIPDFPKEYQTITNKALGVNQGAAKKAVYTALLHGTPDEQMVALKRFHGFNSTNPSETQKIYADFLTNKNLNVARTALRMIAQHPDLRPDPKQYNKLLLNILNGNREELLPAVFEVIQKTEPVDTRIDLTLSQIGHNELYSGKNRQMALALLGVRKAAGLVRLNDSDAVAKAVMKGLVGNRAIESKLKALIGDYFHTIDNARHIGPALKLFLPGQAGIGKTMLISRLQNQLFGNPEDLIVIHPKQISKERSLATLLKERAKEDDDGKLNLDNRVILIDEFQAVDSIQPESVRDKFLEDLKTLFPLGKTDVEASQAWLRDEGLEMRYPVLAIAMNGDFNRLNVIRNKNEAALALKSRLQGTIIPGSPNRLELAEDLTAFIPDFINQFGQERYFEDIEHRAFDGPVHLSNEAKQFFYDKLNQVARYEGSIQGRTLSELMVEDINRAIQNTESSHHTPFHRVQTSEGPGKIIDSLIIDVNKQNELEVRQGELTEDSSYEFRPYSSKKPLSSSASDAQSQSIFSKFSSLFTSEQEKPEDPIPPVGKTSSVASSKRSSQQAQSVYSASSSRPETHRSKQSTVSKQFGKFKLEDLSLPSSSRDPKLNLINELGKEWDLDNPFLSDSDDGFETPKAGMRSMSPELKIPGAFIQDKDESDEEPPLRDTGSTFSRRKASGSIDDDDMTPSKVSRPLAIPRPISPTKSYFEIMRSNKLSRASDESTVYDSALNTPLPNLRSSNLNDYSSLSSRLRSQRGALGTNSHTTETFTDAFYHVPPLGSDPLSEDNPSESRFYTPWARSRVSAYKASMAAKATRQRENRSQAFDTQPPIKADGSEVTSNSSIMTSQSKLMLNAQLQTNCTPVRIDSELKALLDKLEITEFEKGRTYPMKDIFTRAHIQKHIFLNPKHAVGEDQIAEAIRRYPSVAQTYGELRNYFLNLLELDEA